VSLALTTDETLLALKIGFLVLLYIFVWVVVRTATRHVTAAPQESIILSASEAAALRAAAGLGGSRLVVLASPGLRQGTPIEVSGALTIGRGPDSDLSLDGDGTVSSRHAKLSRRPDGLWVEDAGSTNGTFVNGARVTTARLLQVGDVVRVGHTDLLVER
jgi:pSer/pThr/pTyr-binding forkhead associated (FHA) protein